MDINIHPRSLGETLFVGGVVALGVGIWLPWIAVRPGHTGPIPGIYYPGMDSGVEFLDWLLLALLGVLVGGFLRGFTRFVNALFLSTIGIFLAVFIFFEWFFVSLLVILVFGILRSFTPRHTRLVVTGGIVTAVLTLRYMYMQVGMFGFGEESYVDRIFIPDVGVYLSLVGALLLITAGVVHFQASRD